MGEKKGFFKRLVEGLTKTRDSIMSGIDSIFSGFSKIDDDFYEELEEILIMGDLGVATTTKIIEGLREKVKEQKIKEPQACKQLLVETIKEQMTLPPNAYEYEEKTSVVMLIGVNGVGKTTSIGKLASQLKGQGRKVIMAAADTFRAAAIEQLTEWAKRSGVDIIAQHEGADPAAVIYDAITASKARNADVLLCDTAGRLHNKKNLMEELRKIDKVISRDYPEAYRETLVVLDGTTGQNALAQAKQFSEVADITGIILTKLDGTAKGGIAIAIQSELGIPVKYIGVGEKIEDLQKFDADSFVEALFNGNESTLSVTDEEVEAKMNSLAAVDDGEEAKAEEERRLEAEKKAAEEEEEKRLEAEQKARQETEQKAREEAEALALEERRLEEERKAAKEAEEKRLEVEHKAEQEAEQKARQEAEAKAEEEHRLEAERKAAKEEEEKRLSAEALAQAADTEADGSLEPDEPVVEEKKKKRWFFWKRDKK